MSGPEAEEPPAIGQRPGRFGSGTGGCGLTDEVARAEPEVHEDDDDDVRRREWLTRGPLSTWRWEF